MMLKTTTTIFTIFLFLQSAFTKPVDEQMAKQAGLSFYIHHTQTKNTGDLAISLASKSSSKSMIFYYIFNINQNDGFVIVSGDDITSPILGYNTKGHFNAAMANPSWKEWMINYENQIEMAKNQNLEATELIKSEWSNLINNASIIESRSTTAVAPLLTTTWDQLPYYNDACPFDYTYNKRTVTGCVATAMAQILKFWNYPATGSGFHSYNHPQYGTLSVDFGSASFNWAAMPNSIHGANADIANLMFDCGVSVDMEYGVNESSAWVISADNSVCAQNAYVTYFGYKPSTIQGLERVNYSDADWVNILKNELDNSRPIQYAGFGNGGGHTWVCDGYDANGFFDMNWGWSGIDNGYYNIDALNPGTLGAGGGNGGFNYNQEALIGIEPNTGGSQSSAIIDMNSAISVSPNPINFAQPFSVTADVINDATTDFSGTYCAALFSATGDFIAFVDSLETGNYPLPPGYHYINGLTFASQGLLTVPGNYLIGIYFKPTNGNWIVAGSQNFSNYISITISGPSNDLKLYSNITPSPTTFVQGQSASVNVNLYNTGATTFYGQYAANLYDLQGNYVETIGTYDENNGLPSGYVYQYPYITFTSSSISASPGTYILGILENEAGTSNYYLAGGDLYSNPVNIDVVAAALQPDAYETNNTLQTAYNLTANWSNDFAEIKTNGSNIDNGSDMDYYKIDLPSGYDYTINARAEDSYSSDDGNTYTDDVVASYYDGSNWSAVYDDIVPVTTVKNGGTITFLLSSFFPGQTGTYSLDIKINRVTTTGIDEAQKEQIHIYPNPASNFIHLSFPSGLDIKQASIFNSAGQLMKALTSDELLNRDIDVSSLNNGSYLFEIVNGSDVYSLSFLISK